MRVLRAALCVAALCLAGCATRVPAQENEGAAAPALPEAAPATGASAFVEEGVASWYGLAFQGRRTASGERFDMNAMTAAHPSLPFGTWVEVRSPHNGRSVTVRINDRGPHVAGRIIDLSHAAARSLGLLGFGTKKVVVTVVDAPAGARR